MQVQDSRGIRIKLGEAIKRGGEAKILEVKGKPNLVAKIYHADRAESEAKLNAMLANPPVQPATHTAFAWPIELLYQQGQLVGFLMPKISGYDPIINFYSPARRKKRHAGFNWRYLHRTASNLAVLVERVHQAGHLVGDLNESNVLVNDQALVTLVDTDSFQIAGCKGQIFRCPVGKAEYTAPELQRVSFDKVNRRPEQDHFALAVLIFQLLMQGYHPFSAVLPAHLSVGRVDVYAIKEGLFPYYHNRKPLSIQTPPNAPAFRLLHPSLAALFIRCFVNGHRSPTQRPTGREWRAFLQKAEQALVTCKKQAHIYSNHLATCPFCAPEQAIRKPIPSAVKAQRVHIRGQSSSLRQAVSVEGQGSATKKESSVESLIMYMFLVVGSLTLIMLSLAVDSDRTASPESLPVVQPQASQVVATVTNRPSPSPSPTHSRLFGTPYPEPVVTIAAENAYRIRPLADLAMRDIKEIAYSPDGKWLAAASSTGISLIDSQRLKQVRFIKTDSWTSSVAFSLDSQTLASGSWDGTVRLWSTDGTLIKALEGHTSRVTSVAFSAKTVASASHDKTVRLWSTDATQIKTLEGHTSSVTSVTFSPDGQTVASASHDRTVRLWSTNGALLQTLSGHTSYVNHVAFSPDGQILASASHDKTVRLWSIDGTLLSTLSRHTDWVNRVAFSPNGETVASASNDQTIRLWSTNGTPLYTLSGRSSWVDSVTFSPDGKTVASGSDQKVRVWGVPVAMP